MQANKNKNKLNFQHIKLKRSHTETDDSFQQIPSSVDNKPKNQQVSLLPSEQDISKGSNLISEHELLVHKLTYIFNNDTELAHYVADLKTIDSKPLYSLQNKEAIYTLYFIFIEKEKQGVMTFVNSLVDQSLQVALIPSEYKPVLAEQQDYENITIFNSPLLKDVQFIQKQKHNLLLKKHIPIETKRQCMYCGHNKFFQTIMQTRRADEGMTTLFSCANCGKGGKEN